VALAVLVSSAPAAAQAVETIGSRALGMGGAFVAVANDSSATWWNPAGLAAGPFLDMSLARAVTFQDEELPAWRGQGSWFAVGTPPLGLSYYRLRLTSLGPPVEDAGTPVVTVPVTLFGVTLVQTLFDGVHAGATLKYARGTFRSAWDEDLARPGDSIGARLARGEDLDSGGRTDHRFDADVGIIAVRGALRAGGVLRQIRRPRFGEVTLPRQARIGAAFDGHEIGTIPLTVAFDADLRAYETSSGPRRVVALGAEQWLFDRRVAVRGGGRINTAGARERATTFGASYAAQAGLYLDGHLVRGGAAGERGWGLAARVSF
jgi:hypothetical protein